MKIEIRMEQGGWPTFQTVECRPETELTAFIEKLIHDQALPSIQETSEEKPEYSEEVKSVYVIKRGDTEEEIASYHPLLRKIIPLTEKGRMKNFFGGDSGKMLITAVSMEERKEQIADKVTMKEPSRPENAPAKTKWWKTGSGPLMDDMDTKEEEKVPETPYDKEAMLLDLAMGIMGYDQNAGKGSGISLWIYLLGFVLVCAFMVKTLISMINYDPLVTSFPIYTPILANALTMLLPAGLCFAGGKIADSVAAKRNKL